MIVFEPSHRTPLVSVVITCFNQGHFLSEAISSAVKQTWTNIEIIVVDDGSWDNTREVTAKFHGVRYHHQPNSGLSAARNRGVALSRGAYIIFLDADDWLYPRAVETNLRYIADTEYAFVSGWHDKVDEWNYPVGQDDQVVIEADHYLHLLRGNYIGMHACVMYRRSVFDEFRFDTSLDACEDYDLYLRITRKYPVFNHCEKLAAYRIHGQNMSARLPFMLSRVLKVLRRQRAHLRTQPERKAFLEGRQIWKRYYSRKLFGAIVARLDGRHGTASLTELLTLLRYYPRGMARYVGKWLMNTVKHGLRRRLPDPILSRLHEAGFVTNYTPRPGFVRDGDFHRVTPFSYDFGYDRGGPIDRVYIESFLDANRKWITGTVLEIGDNEYTMRFGGANVAKSDILHVDSSNAKATYIGDITHIPQIPSEKFDCIIFTQTLHLIYDFKSALNTCHRILKPGGSLLLTVPGISHIDYGEWRDFWLWSFTDKAIRRLLLENFREDAIEVRSYGNVYVSAAFLYGMGLPECKKEFLTYNDPSYQLIVSARATKW